jgi:hypothetical protein
MGNQLIFWYRLVTVRVEVCDAKHVSLSWECF